MQGYFDLNPQVYDRCVRLFERGRKLLGVRIQMHHEQGQIDAGDIFLFNHFARAETFIPQYCIYEATGTLCRSVAAGELFRGNERLAGLLRDVGAVPNDHPALLSLLAIDLLKGRKVVFFPEGGMVKDRQVVDADGRYSVYSRAASARRKHHSGAARLAVGLQIFKLAVLARLERARQADVERWAEQIGLPSVQLLIERARRPVTVVPANITFYPLRTDDNFLRRGADLVFGKLSPRATEELIIEGNLFFKATDMDIRLGAPVRADVDSNLIDRYTARLLARHLPSLETVYIREWFAASLPRRFAARRLDRAIERLRDRCMRDIYRTVTVNLSHLAARLLIIALEHGMARLDRHRLARLIYVALKKLQTRDDVYLHRSLYNPQLYRQLVDGDWQELREFLDSAVAHELIARDGDALLLLDKLRQDHHFDSVRIENPIEVYANEVTPIDAVRDATASAWDTFDALTARDFAALAFDDLRIEHEWDRRLFDKDRHREMNARETATADASPFLLLGERPRRVGVLLAHGFLASPAEVRPLAERLHAANFRVLGVRLRGHGTSPWDLRERAWRDWLDSVRRGYDILHAYCDEICLVGFSTGAALSLVHAAEQPSGLAGLVACSTPVRFRNRNLRFVPFVHGANQIIEWVSSHEGVMPFRPNDPEHPDINYRHMPVRGLWELTRMVSHVKDRLPAVRCPALILQADDDHVVDPDSAQQVYTRIGSVEKSLYYIPTRRHGIVNENIGNTHLHIVEFLERIDAADVTN